MGATKPHETSSEALHLSKRLSQDLFSLTYLVGSAFRVWPHKRPTEESGKPRLAFNMKARTGC